MTASTSASKKTEKYFYGLGRRKTSTARVRLYKGTGKIVINDKPGEEYVNFADLIPLIQAPLLVTEQQSAYDISARVNGGGVISQAEAIRLGVAKALVALDNAFRPKLRQYKYLTTDSRVIERKKPGLKKARKAPQYTKR
ncbi:MAG TPA: 30S ribosomal protein S9 [bacterium]|nr:30S ribosomal protein S9 [bacterium]